MGGYRSSGSHRARRSKGSYDVFLRALCGRWDRLVWGPPPLPLPSVGRQHSVMHYLGRRRFHGIRSHQLLSI